MITTVAVLAAVVVWSQVPEDTGRSPAAPSQGSGEPSPTSVSVQPEAGLTPQETRAAEAYVGFAAGTATTVLWADNVAFTVEGRLVRTVDPDAAGRAESWQGCPDGTATYEGRDCPVSALDPLRLLVEEGQVAVVEPTWPDQLACSVRTPVRGAGAAPGLAVLRPPVDQRSCFTDFAVTLLLDGSGAITAVDLVLEGP